MKIHQHDNDRKWTKYQTKKIWFFKQKIIGSEHHMPFQSDKSMDVHEYEYVFALSSSEINWLNGFKLFYLVLFFISVLVYLLIVFDLNDARLHSNALPLHCLHQNKCWLKGLLIGIWSLFGLLMKSMLIFSFTMLSSLIRYIKQSWHFEFAKLFALIHFHTNRTNW